ncbi:MAG TPA: hypothetical protein VG455_06660 [Acidimicrobiales bacterium]|nr:hypothetical protein [Acidimicrobiales bacterium]
MPFPDRTDAGRQLAERAAEGLDEPVMSDTARRLGLGDEELAPLGERARRELARRVEHYRTHAGAGAPRGSA